MLNLFFFQDFEMHTVLRIAGYSGDITFLVTYRYNYIVLNVGIWRRYREILEVSAKSYSQH
jgi:hypothetical protein